jgi:hypothetical protein
MSYPLPSSFLYNGTDLFKSSPFPCLSVGNLFWPIHLQDASDAFVKKGVQDLFFTFCHLPGFAAIYCEITFIRGVPIFVVFVGRLIHEIKNPTNNETWVAV